MSLFIDPLLFAALPLPTLWRWARATVRPVATGTLGASRC
jgi:hypothetical protein